MNPSTFKTVAAFVVTLALTVYVWPAHSQDEVARSFAVMEGDRVVVEVERARIVATAWDRPEVAFSATGADRLEFSFNQDNGELRIEGRGDGPGGLFRWLGGESRAEIALSVPYRQHLNLRTSGGGIAIDRLQGEFSARTSGGDIQAGAIDGPVDATTSGGGIRVDTAGGAVAARTSGGSIRLGEIAGAVDAATSGGSIRIIETSAATEARTSGGSIEIENAGGAVRARTSGGSVEVGFAGQPEADSELRTAGGNVTVHLPDGFRAELSGSASGGSVQSDLPGATSGRENGRGSIEQSLNGGGPELVLKTSGGSIRIRHRES